MLVVIVLVQIMTQDSPLTGGPRLAFDYEMEVEAQRIQLPSTSSALEFLEKSRLEVLGLGRDSVV